MKRSSFNVLFFLKKTKLLKDGEASVCMRITVDGMRVENNIPKVENIKPVDPLLYSQLIHQKKHWIYEKKNAF